MKKIRRKLSMILGVLLLLVWTGNIHAEEVLEPIKGDGNLVSAQSAVLIEASTGKILYEKEKDMRRSPASITKIMTLLLIFDALEKQEIHMEDLVTTSAYAKSMGGSQVFLEEGEQQSVETLIKCIVIASGNDASVTMAEHIAGSEETFVKKMNERAKELGLHDTHFVDCCGLTESQEHYTSAYDVAVMRRELITKYPKVLDYSSIWMENIIHVTKRGNSEFGLTNTNKLLRSYEGCKGLKTGSTSIAKYCFSGVAERNGITLIAVVMAAPDYKARFGDAASMLDFGFARCSLYIDKNEETLPDLPVLYGEKKRISLSYEEEFRYLKTDGKPVSDIRKKVKLPEAVEAPVKKGDTVGEMCYYMKDTELGKVRILCAESSERASYFYCIRKVFLTAFDGKSAA